ncbi:MAG: hypothetical protein HRU75_12585 [Planctomycetia bacterium]|nr:MAG: hypothetical protein HRU75_12585 [Planctomycetia bacterium]
MTVTTVAAAALLWLPMPGCERGDPAAKPGGQKIPVPASAGNDAAEAAAHQHLAPHGGVLVELGDHDANAEMLLDPDTGRLRLWLLDGCAANSLRSEADEIRMLVILPATPDRGESMFNLTLDAVANPLTGETLGDTSEFSVTSEDLRGVRAFKGVIQRIEMHGERYSDVSFEYAPVGRGSGS